jgi:hypothetical protein
MSKYSFYTDKIHFPNHLLFFNSKLFTLQYSLTISSLPLSTISDKPLEIVCCEGSISLEAQMGDKINYIYPRDTIFSQHERMPSKSSEIDHNERIRVL